MDNKASKIKEVIINNINELEKYMYKISKIEPPILKSICNIVDGCTECPFQHCSADWCHYEEEEPFLNDKVIRGTLWEAKHIVEELENGLNYLEESDVS